MFLLANWGFITGSLAHNGREQSHPSGPGLWAANWNLGLFSVDASQKNTELKTKWNFYLFIILCSLRGVS